MFNSFTDIPRINNFEQARMHYESIKPIRGSDNLRPLCGTPNGRRKKHLQIIELGYGNAYALRVYDTNVITYKRDGAILINNGGWATATTHGFITEALMHLGVSARTRSESTWLNLRCGDFRIADGVDAILEPNEDGNLILRNPEPVYVHRLNRKVWNGVRKQHSAFLSYIESMSKLVEPANNADRWHRNTGLRTWITAHNVDREGARATLTCEDPNEGWAQLLEMFTLGATQFDWNWGASEFNARIVRSKFKRQAYELLKYFYADEIFIREEAPLGAYVKDTNARFVK